jgi:capsular polysaccharide biosynthesis protein
MLPALTHDLAKGRVSLMELIAIARVLLRRWVFIALPVIVAGALLLPRLLNSAATGGGYSTTLRYTASQVLSAIPGRDGDFQDVWLASELTVNALSDWITGARFAEEVSAELAAVGISIPPDALRGRFIADNARSVGQLTITWPNEPELVEITLAAINVLRTRTNTYFPQLGGQPAQVELLDTPTFVAVPPSLPSRFGPLLQMGVALLAGVILAFAVEYFDPLLYRRDQLEALHLTVVAHVPPER